MSSQRPIPDKYASFADLEKGERLGVDYRVRSVSRKARTAIVAPHGGRIEPGTSEIAEAIALEDLSFYAFEGIKRRNNGRLHITSTGFDEPACFALVTQAERVITINTLVVRKNSIGTKRQSRVICCYKSLSAKYRP